MRSFFNAISQGRDLNLVNMILNLESNNFNNYQKIRDVFDVYINYDKINFSQDFKESLNNSKMSINNISKVDGYLQKLQENNPNSFLILPLKGCGHLWSAVVRKTDEGYNAVVINKGLRNSHDPLEEFVFNKESQDKLIETLYDASQIEPVEDVYKSFLENSDKAYNLKIYASSQKVGNCFTKNIQAAIKFAQATRNMSVTELRKYRTDGYTPNGTLKKGKTNLKWENTRTEDVHKDFVSNVIEKNPLIKSKAEEQLRIYLANKHFRECIGRKENPTNSLINSFAKEYNFRNLKIEDQIKESTKKLTYYTFMKTYKYFGEIAKKSNDPVFISTTNNLLKDIKMTNYIKRNRRFELYITNGLDPLKALQKAFDKKQNLKNLSDTQKIKRLVGELTLFNVIRYKKQVCLLLKKAYGEKFATERYLELSKAQSLKHFDFYKKVASVKFNLFNNSKCYPLVTKEMKFEISKFFASEMRRGAKEFC